MAIHGRDNIYGQELGSPTWWEADSLVTVKRKLERVYYEFVGKSLLNESPCNGERLAVNREKQGRQAHEASVHRKGRTNACHLPGTSDVLLWGLPISRQLSVFFPSYLLRCEKYRMLDAWMLFLYFLLNLITDSRH